MYFIKLLKLKIFFLLFLSVSLYGSVITNPPITTSKTHSDGTPHQPDGPGVMVNLSCTPPVWGVNGSVNESVNPETGHCSAQITARKMANGQEGGTIMEYTCKVCGNRYRDESTKISHNSGVAALTVNTWEYEGSVSLNGTGLTANIALDVPVSYYYDYTLETTLPIVKPERGILIFTGNSCTCSQCNKTFSITARTPVVFRDQGFISVYLSKLIIEQATPNRFGPYYFLPTFQGWASGGILKDPINPSCGQQVIDINGFPISKKKPQQENENDQHKQEFNIDVATLSVNYTVSDLSYPIGNGESKLELRRTFDTTYMDWKFNTDIVAWSSGNALEGAENTVIDEDGRRLRFDPSGMEINTGWQSTPAKELSKIEFNLAQGYCLWKKKYGGTFKFKLSSSRSTFPAQTPPQNCTAESVYTYFNYVFQIDTFTDKYGNVINYEYNNSAYPSLLTGIRYKDMRISLEYVNGKLKTATGPDGKRVEFEYPAGIYEKRISKVKTTPVNVSTESNLYGSSKELVTEYSYTYDDAKSITIKEPGGNTYRFQYGDHYAGTTNLGNGIKYVSSPNGTVSINKTCDWNGGYDSTVTDIRGNKWVYKYSNPDLIKTYYIYTYSKSHEFSQINRYPKIVRSTKDLVGFDEFERDTIYRVEESYTYINTRCNRFLYVAGSDVPSNEVEWHYYIDQEYPAVDNDFPSTTGSYLSFAVNLWKVRDAFGNKKLFSYASQQTAFNHVPNYEITVPSSGTSISKSFQYNPGNYMSALSSPRNATTSYVMEGPYRFQENAPEGKTSRYGYDNSGYQVHTYDADNRFTEASKTLYGGYGYWLENKTIKGYGGELGIASSKKYNLGGKVLSETDANGNVTTYEYDALDNVMKITKPPVYDSVSGTTVTPVVQYYRDVDRNIIGKRDEKGVLTLYTYDKMGRMTSKTVKMEDGNDLVTRMSYDKGGNMVTKTDPKGVTTNYTYDVLNRLVKESTVNPNSSWPMSKTYEYGTNCGNDVFADQGFQPTKIIDRKGISDEMVYDGNYRLLQKKRDGILLEEFEYDASGNVTLHTKHNIVNGTGTPQRTKTVYDMLERPTIKVVDLNGNGADENDSGDAVTRYTYDKVGNVIQEIDPEGKTVNRLYDGANRLVRETVVIDGSNDLVTEYQYDGNGNKTKIIVHNETGSGNQETVMTYDALNRLTSTTDAEGNTESYQYDLAGNKTVAIDKRGFRTDFYYDNARRLVKTVMPQVLNGETSSNVRPQTTQVYDKNGNVTQSTDARGLVTNNVYDVLNRLTRKTVQAESAIVTTYTYDDNNNKLTETLQRDDANLTTTYTYDSFNRPITTTDPEGFMERYYYDTVGNKIAKIDKLGFTTNYTYSYTNLLLSTIFPGVDCYETATSQAEKVRPVASTSYYKNGLIFCVTNAKGATSQNFYDIAGRKSKIIDAEGGITEQVYDKAGNIIRLTVHDSKGAGDRVTAMSYDKLNRLIQEKLEPDTALERIYMNVYDANGNKTSRQFPDENIVNASFDSLNRKSSETYPGAPQENRAFTYTLNNEIAQASDATGITTYSHDKRGYTINEVKKDNNSNIVSRITSKYDKAGNRISAIYNTDRTLSFSYDKRNLLKEVKDGAKVTSYTYNNNGARTNLKLPNNVNTVTVFDEMGNVNSIASYSAGAEIYSALYRCDRIGNRVMMLEKRANEPDRTVAYSYDLTSRLTGEDDGTANTSFTYDDAGNRLTKTVNGVTTVYSVDKLNRVLSATTGENTTTYAYDLNGNRQSKIENGVTHNYIYDKENRLVSVKDAGNIELFHASYDHRTRRISAVENGIETRYIYDGGDCVQERDNAGSLKTVLIRGTSMGGGIGGILYTEDVTDNTREFFLYNAIGSTVATTGDSGNLISGNVYDAWGKVIRTIGTSTNDRLFATKERTASIGLDNFGFRYYDPELGRFIQRDPIGYPDGHNNYLYCENNPVNKIDPLGLEMPWYDRALNAAANFSAGMADKITMGATDKLRSAMNINDTVNKSSTSYKSGEVAGTVHDAAMTVTGAGAIVKQVAKCGIKATVESGVKVAVTQELNKVAVNTAETGLQAAVDNNLISQDTAETVKASVSVAKTLSDGLSLKEFDKVKCFPAGTPVLMADGTVKTIEEIKEGDYVLAFEPEKDVKASKHLVTGTIKNWTERLIRVAFDENADGLSEGAVWATGEHPFWTVNKGWVNAVDLKVGDILLNSELKKVKVSLIIEEKRTCDTFNISVESVHTFFVVSNGIAVLVHNADKQEEVKPKIHGNSKDSVKPQHSYDIVDTQAMNETTGKPDVVKTGISGQELNDNGTSPRANQQVNKFNKAEGNERYKADIVETGIPDRKTALEKEQIRVNKLDSSDDSLREHNRPKPQSQACK